LAKFPLRKKYLRRTVEPHESVWKSVAQGGPGWLIVSFGGRTLRRPQVVCGMAATLVSPCSPVEASQRQGPGRRRPKSPSQVFRGNASPPLPSAHGSGSRRDRTFPSRLKWTLRRCRAFPFVICESILLPAVVPNSQPSGEMSSRNATAPPSPLVFFFFFDAAVLGRPTEFTQCAASSEAFPTCGFAVNKYWPSPSHCVPHLWAVGHHDYDVVGACASCGCRHGPK